MVGSRHRLDPPRKLLGALFGVCPLSVVASPQLGLSIDIGSHGGRVGPLEVECREGFIELFVCARRHVCKRTATCDQLAPMVNARIAQSRQARGVGIRFYLSLKSRNVRCWGFWMTPTQILRFAWLIACHDREHRDHGSRIQ